MNALAGGLHRGWRWSLALSTAVGCGIVVLLLRLAGPDPIWPAVTSIDPGYIALATALTVVTYAARAWRFRVLLGHGPLATLYWVVSVHTLMVNLLPLGAGDLAYPVLVKQYGMARRLLEGIAQLLVVRIQDLVITIAFLSAAILWLPGLRVDAPDVSGRALLALAGALMAVALAGWYGARRRDTRLRSPVRRWFAELATALSGISLFVWTTSFLIGVASRLVAIVGTMCLFHAVGITLSFPAVALIASLYTFLPYLPLMAVAGIGATEMLLFGGLVGSGVTPARAAMASVQIHALQLLVVAALGCCGAIQLQYQRWLDGRRPGRTVGARAEEAA